MPQLFTNRDLFEDEEAGQQEEDSSAEIYLSLKGSLTIALCSRHMRKCWLCCAGGCIWLAIATIFIALLSEIVTGTLEGIHHDEYCYVAVDTCKPAQSRSSSSGAAASWNLGESFVGFVLLPIVGNAAEHSTAVTMAYKGGRS